MSCEVVRNETSASDSSSAKKAVSSPGQLPNNAEFHPEPSPTFSSTVKQLSSEPESIQKNSEARMQAIKETESAEIENFGDHPIPAEEVCSLSDEEAHDNGDVPRPVRMFVGQVPETMVEPHITSLFAKKGIKLMDVAVIRDRHTGRHRHCAFVTVPSRESADIAIEEFHNKKYLESMANPMQVREANQPKSKAAYAAMKAYSQMFGTPMPIFASQSTKTAYRPNQSTATFPQLIPMSPFLATSYMQHMQMQMQPISPYTAAYSASPYVYGYVPTVATASPSVSINPMQLSPMGYTYQSASMQQAQLYPSLGTVMSPNGQASTQNLHRNDSGCSSFSSGRQMSYTSQDTNATEVVPNGYDSSVIGTNENSSKVPSVDCQRQAQSYSMPCMSYSGYQMGDVPLQTTTPETNADLYRGNEQGGTIYYTSNGQYGSPMYASFADSTAVYSSPEDNASKTTTYVEGPSGANLFVNNLPDGFGDKELLNLFSMHGDILSCKVFVDKYTQKSKGFGFVSFNAVDDAQNAIAEKNGHELEGGRRLLVELKRSKRTMLNDFF